MAEKMQISRDTYRNIEQHPEKASVKQAQQIAEITGVELNLIFFG
jgi:DNA-binding XRE family transcriptional regulator